MRAGISSTLYLSGHGFQQPDADGDEDDGYDELFLPIDIERWKGPEDGPKAIRNAIRDEEIGAAVTRLRNAGADVWVILDSCHSGTGIRAASEAVRAKRLRAADLGFRGAPVALTRKETGVAHDNGALVPEKGAGFLVAFYAAQSSQQALEIGYPLDARDDREREFHSLFTARLVARLKAGGRPSFRQLYQALQLDIEESRERGGRRQDPDLEVDRPETADRFPFAAASEVPGAQWRLRDGRIVEAGALQGLQAGSILALVSDPAAAEDEVVGHVQIAKAGALTSTAKPIAYPCERGSEGQSDCRSAEDNSYLKSARFARLLEPALDLSLRLSKPILLDDGDDPENAALVAALASLGKRAADDLGFTLLPDQETFDVAVGLKGGRIWFGDSAGSRTSVSATTSPASPGRPRAAVLRTSTD